MAILKGDASGDEERCIRMADTQWPTPKQSRPFGYHFSLCANTGRLGGPVR
jgi:hypothetical protein